MKTGDVNRNCAFYVVVGNNLKNGQRAEFYFYRTDAIALFSKLFMTMASVLAVVAISL